MKLVLDRIEIKIAILRYVRDKLKPRNLGVLDVGNVELYEGQEGISAAVHLKNL